MLLLRECRDKMDTLWRRVRLSIWLSVSMSVPFCPLVWPTLN